MILILHLAKPRLHLFGPVHGAGIETMQKSQVKISCMALILNVRIPLCAEVVRFYFQSCWILSGITRHLVMRLYWVINMNKNELIDGKEYLVKLETWYAAEYTQGALLLDDGSDHLPELCEEIIPLDLALRAEELQDALLDIAALTKGGEDPPYMLRINFIARDALGEKLKGDKK